MVTVLAVIDAGATADPPGREGLAQLTAEALEGRHCKLATGFRYWKVLRSSAPHSRPAPIGIARS